MTFREQVRQEIIVKVEALAAAMKPLHPAWITHDICDGHLDGLSRDSNDAAFWREGTYHAVRAEVGQYLRKYYSTDRDADDEDKQLTLPGYEHVQTHYIVERDGNELAIPTPLLTNDEIDAIISRIRATGMALFAHADDLVRFKRSRTVPPLFAEAGIGLAK